MKLKLDIDFKEAFEKISETEKNIPSDVLLRLYAYYKQAIKGDIFTSKEVENESDLRNAFKFNAWVQLKGMSAEEAKKEYVDLANKVLG